MIDYTISDSFNRFPSIEHSEHIRKLLSLKPELMQSKHFNSIWIVGNCLERPNWLNGINKVANEQTGKLTWRRDFTTMISLHSRDTKRMFRKYDLC